MKPFDTRLQQTIKLLKSNRHTLSPQQYRTLKGQCLAGDVDGAIKGLDKILRHTTKEKNNENNA